MLYVSRLNLKVWGPRAIHGPCVGYEQTRKRKVNMRVNQEAFRKTVSI